MVERTAILSNAIGVALTLALVAGLLALPSAAPAGLAGAPASVEIALESAPPAPPPPEPEPVQPQTAAPPPPEIPQTPPPDQPPPPPPTPPPVENPEPPKEADPEPPKPESILRDEDGEKIAQAQVQQLDPQVAARVNALLGRISKYPEASTRKLKAKPRGQVGVEITIVDGKVSAVEVVQSSGSPILDQAAKSTAAVADMSFVGPGSFKFTGRFQF